jgi:RNA polymerase sigma-70 factor, ECF subfamily
MRGTGPGPADDAALVRAIVAGSHDALAVLYDRHADAIYAAACRLTSDRGMAEDVVQETFLVLWDRAETYDPSLGSLAAWLHTIARNRTIDRLRAAGRRPPTVPLSSAAARSDGGGIGTPEPDADALERVLARGEMVGGATPSPTPEMAFALRELRDALRVALAEMPEDERTVIVLAYGEDLTQAEIAERLGWPLGTVKTRTRRALARLRGVLGSGIGPELTRYLAPASSAGPDH